MPTKPALPSVAQLLTRGHRCVVVEGELGSGKTRLLTGLDSGGFTVLSAELDDGDEALPFSAVDLLLASLPGAPARTTDDESVVARGLVEAAESLGPVVVIIDGDQWTDRASSRTLFHALRLLRRHPIVVVLTTRDRSQGLAERIPDAEIIRLEPLDRNGVRRLARARGVELGPGAAEDLAVRCDGNPLSVIAVLDAVAASPGGAVPDRVPEPPRLRRAIDELLERLGPEARRTAEVLAVADGPVPGDVVTRVVERLGAVPSLDRLLKAGLLEPASGDPSTPVRLRSERLRAGVVDRLDGQISRRLSAEMAMESTGSTALRHRLASSRSTDDDLAAEIAAHAQDAQRQGAFGHATELWLRAASARTRKADADDDVLRAGVATWLSGDAVRASTLGARIEVVAPSRQRELVIAALGFLTGDFDDAWARLPAVDPGSVLDALVRAAFDWRIGRFAEGHDTLRRVTPQALSEEPLLATRLHERLAYLTWFVHGGREALDALADLPVTTGARLIRGEVLLFTGEPLAARTELMLAVGAARAADAGPDIQEALAHAAIAEFQLGRWSDARAHALSAIEFEASTGNHNQAALAHAVLAMIAAACGNRDEAMARSRAADTAASRWWVPQTLGMAALARAAVASAFDDHDGVLAATAIFTGSLLEEQAGRSGYAWWRPLEVRALVGVGRLDDARRVLDRIESESSAPVFGGPGDLRALIEDASGDVAEALRLVRDAVAGWPHPVAPAALAAAHRLEARLRQVLGDRAGHDAATAMARSIERRLGIPAERRDLSDPFAVLSSREADVARLAARGRTNREIAQELFVTVKTVEFHMARLLAKLGLTSRRGLRDLG